MTARLPKAVWSALGPLPVLVTAELPEETLGQVDFRPREVTIDKTAGPETRVSTFWHELTHIAVWDAGVHNILTHEQHEAVCDAVGAYLGGMMLAGCLTIRAPK